MQLTDTIYANCVSMWAPSNLGQYSCIMKFYIIVTVLSTSCQLASPERYPSI